MVLEPWVRVPLDIVPEHFVAVEIVVPPVRPMVVVIVGLSQPLGQEDNHK